jgi:GT2 family glycosyltransferase
MFPSGAAGLYRKRMLDAVGLFDEDFFAYGEDADIGWRGRLAGWTCVFVPTAVVYHRYSASSSAYSPLKAFWVERNRLWLAIKNFPLPVLFASPVYTLVRYAWQGYGALSGIGAAGEFTKQYSKAQLLLIVLKAYASAFVGAGKMIRKRKAIQQSVTVSTKDVLAWFSRYGISVRELSLQA